MLGRVWKAKTYCRYSQALQVVDMSLWVMVRPIKDTPVLYDEDAYRFEMAARNVVPLSEEKRKAIFRNYEEVRSWCATDVL